VGSENWDLARSIHPTSDDGYIIVGYTSSPETMFYDCFIVKLDPFGSVVWHRIYGMEHNEFLHHVIQTSDGGYAAAGWTSSTSDGRSDLLVLKLDDGGNISWQKTYGGRFDEDGRCCIQQTTDGGYVVSGDTSSFDAGSKDIWVLKMDENGNIFEDCPPGIGEDTSNLYVTLSIVQGNTSAAPVDSSATFSDTSTTPEDTAAITATQCSR